VPGVDGVFIGPADLAISYGLPPSMTPVPGVHADALAQIRSACKRAGVAIGIPCADAAAARDRVAEGYTLVTLGSDAQWITESARTQLQALREGRPSPSQPDGL
jgi:4-hydroxy-2-oxoheptanedioate aldolase